MDSVCREIGKERDCERREKEKDQYRWVRVRIRYGFCLLAFCSVFHFLAFCPLAFCPKEDIHNLRVQGSHTQPLRLLWSILHTVAEDVQRICGKIYIPIHATLNNLLVRSYLKLHVRVF